MTTCERKQRYTYKKMAQRAVQIMKIKGIPGLSVYKCQSCNGFHIGHSSLNSHIWELLPERKVK